MLETLKQIAECLTDYIRLAKATILAFIAVVAFFKKFSGRTIYVRVLHFFKNALSVRNGHGRYPDSKKIQIVGQTPSFVRHS